MRILTYICLAGVVDGVVGKWSLITCNKIGIALQMHVVEVGPSLHARTRDMPWLLVHYQLLAALCSVRVSARLVLTVDGLWAELVAVLSKFIGLNRVKRVWTPWRSLFIHL